MYSLERNGTLLYGMDALGSGTARKGSSLPFKQSMTMPPSRIPDVQLPTHAASWHTILTRFTFLSRKSPPPCQVDCLSPSSDSLWELNFCVRPAAAVHLHINPSPPPESIPKAERISHSEALEQSSVEALDASLSPSDSELVVVPFLPSIAFSFFGLTRQQ